MRCGTLPRSLIQVLADALYKDENGNVFLNTSVLKVDCGTITPVASCNISINEEFVSEGIATEDVCENGAIQIGSNYGIYQNVRIITESSTQLYTDEVIISSAGGNAMAVHST